ncbi:MAG: hypothetical protein WC549_04575 [Actinomycetota bacterium]
MTNQFTPLQRIELLILMPAREGLMLIKGDSYLTGSDYSPEYLKQTIEELEPKEKMGGSIYHFGNILDDKIWYE